MPDSALDTTATSTSHAAPSTISPTPAAPPDEAPIATTAAPGSAARKLTRPTPALPTTFSPQVRLNSADEPRIAAPTVTFSSTRIGTTRYVTSDQAMPTSPIANRP